jgi:hypothetical protein
VQWGGWGTTDIKRYPTARDYTGPDGLCTTNGAILSEADGLSLSVSPSDRLGKGARSFLGQIMTMRIRRLRGGNPTHQPKSGLHPAAKSARLTAALGQKLPRRDQIVMSALPPKAAAAVADRCGS